MTRLKPSCDSAPLTTSACPVQRWRLGRAYWRVDRDEGFRGTDYSVDEIRDGVAREFVKREHYSSSYPFAKARIGLFRGRHLVGVAVFSIPISGTAVTRYMGLDKAQGVELGRFVLRDEVPYSGESWFLSRALKGLPQLLPEVRAVLAYSDPVRRIAEDGSVVLPGHVGIAYQATNAHYLGRASAKTLFLSKDGRALSSRGVSKVRRQEHGADSAEKMLVRLGAPARPFGQDPAAWVNDVLNGPTFRRLAHPGNHVFCWGVGKRHERATAESGFAPSLSYPKQPDVEAGLPPSGLQYPLFWSERANPTPEQFSIGAEGSTRRASR